jgi:hypothetical protein
MDCLWHVQSCGTVRNPDPVGTAGAFESGIQARSRRYGKGETSLGGRTSVASSERGARLLACRDIASNWDGSKPALICW